MNADGSNLTRLTNNTFEDLLPAWSPDGETIAFASKRHRNWDIYLMDSDGTRQRRLTRSSARDSNPDWSPDGTRLVFQSNRHRNSDDLYAIESDGSQLERLTTGPTADWTPAWSPDGSQIAFTIANYDNGREDIAVLDLETAVIARFVISDSFDIEPDWQPVPVSTAP